VQASFDDGLARAARAKPAARVHCCHHRNSFSGIEAAPDEIFALGHGIRASMILGLPPCSGHGNFGRGR
jgi:hypothetical protein